MIRGSYKENLNSAGNMRLCDVCLCVLARIVCAGKKLCCYITEGEFVDENSPDTIYHSVAGFNKDTA